MLDSRRERDDGLFVFGASERCHTYCNLRRPFLGDFHSSISRSAWTGSRLFRHGPHNFVPRCWRTNRDPSSSWTLVRCLSFDIAESPGQAGSHIPPARCRSEPGFAEAAPDSTQQWSSAPDCNVSEQDQARGLLDPITVA